MKTGSIMTKHFKETVEFKGRQKKEWNQLLKAQEDSLIKEGSTVQLVQRFTKERDEHNKKFAQEKRELLERQKTELEELKKQRENERPDEIER